MPHRHPRRRGNDLEADLLDRARHAGETVPPPTVETVVSVADHRDAAELRARQLAAIVRLLRHAFDLRPTA